MYSSEPAARTGEASVRGLHHPEPGGDGRMAGWEGDGTFGSFRGSSACLQRVDGGWGMGWRCREWCGEGMGREARDEERGGMAPMVMQNVFWATSFLGNWASFCVWAAAWTGDGKDGFFGLRRSLSRGR